MTDPAAARVHYLPGSRPERDAPAAEPFRPWYVSEMQGEILPPDEWLVDGVLLRKSVMIFAGPPKIGKTLLAQHLLTACALGEPWLKWETVKCKGFGLFTEDSDKQLKRRQADFNAYYGREPSELGADLAIHSAEGRDAELVTFDRSDKAQATQLWHQMKSYVADEGVQLVVLDNARVIFGGNENWPRQVKTWVRWLVQWSIEIDGCIILLAHPPKGKENEPGFAGTGAWFASVRAGMSLHRPRDWDPEQDTIRDPRRVLTGLGANYGGGIGAERLEYRDGLFVPSDDDGKPRHERRRVTESNRTDLRYRLLMGLKRSILRGAEVPADVTKPGSMPRRARQLGDDEISWVPFNDLYRLQEELIDAGQAIIVRVGPKLLLRPKDGPYYAGEEPFVPAKPPTHAGEVRNAAD